MDTKDRDQPKSPEKSQPPEVEIDPQKLESYMRQARLEQNLSLGLLGGAGAALIGAGAWALITVLTEYQIGFMALAVGIFVGFTMRKLGKGVDTIFGIAGAVLAFLGCFLGNLFSITYFISMQESIPFFDVLNALNLGAIFQLMAGTFQFMDLLFYGLAVYEGYRFSFRKISEEELLRLAR